LLEARPESGIHSSEIFDETFLHNALLLSFLLLVLDSQRFVPSK